MTPETTAAPGNRKSGQATSLPRPGERAQEGQPLTGPITKTEVSTLSGEPRDAASGTPQWAQAVGGTVVSMALSGGALYAGCDDGHLRAFSVADGSLTWTFPTGGPVRSGIAVAGGVVYFGSDDGNVYAVGTVTGKRRWAYHTGQEVASGLAVADGRVFAGSHDNKLYALQA